MHPPLAVLMLGASGGWCFFTNPQTTDQSPDNYGLALANTFSGNWRSNIGDVIDQLVPEQEPDACSSSSPIGGDFPDLGPAMSKMITDWTSSEAETWFDSWWGGVDAALKARKKP